MLIKFCGITNLKDAIAAESLGVSALGFNFYPKSKRYITPEKAAEIIKKLRAEIWKVGVFVRGSEEKIKEIVKLAGLDALQFHGDEDFEFCEKFSNIRKIKAFRLGKTPLEQQEVERFVKAGYYLLIDKYSEQDYGGLGEVLEEEFLPSWIREIKDLKLILAAGLTPENVAERISLFKPAGVDVASGIESEPGAKDEGKMSGFVKGVNGLVNIPVRL